MKKIQKNKLFIQVTYRDLIEKLWLISLFKTNCEVYINPSIINSYDITAVDRAAKLLDRKGILRRVHAPVCDPNRKGFDEYRETYHKTSQFCKRLGAHAMVMHIEGYWPEEHMHIWKEIADCAGKDSIRVLLENHQENSSKPIIRILDAVDSVSLKACFDVGHFYVFGDKDITSILESYPYGSIEEVHLSDNLGDMDAHLSLGSGRIDFPLLFNALDKYSIDPFYTLEAKDLFGVIGGIRYLKKIGRL